MSPEERAALRKEGAPYGFEEEWRTSDKFKMMIRDQRERERRRALNDGEQG